ncbi:MAG: GNAT family N-acetyltransferase [Candidatus Delongbacteria bacterium]|nr:GNAT family N-acetyltransferase [Candidatus Delongbacteria bacterium]MBN2834274.1 GNAT family N-acetyltransferase [Candidatus Delongbacteria bacterium]
MSRKINFQPVTRLNYEKLFRLKIRNDQKKFVPSILESLAYAYIKPWDEAFDPYIIFDNDKMIGFFYVSYTPDSEDNYWIGGFFIDRKYQGMGYGKDSFSAILKFIPSIHKNCKEISLTIEKNNEVARSLYESFGFNGSGEENRDGELIFRFKCHI